MHSAKTLSSRSASYYWLPILKAVYVKSLFHKENPVYHYFAKGAKLPARLEDSEVGLLTNLSQLGTVFATATFSLKHNDDAIIFIELKRHHFSN